MKALYLIRHAKSSWKDEAPTDRERPLNKRGKRDAPFMGELLKQRGVIPDVIISSPALRALKTAQLIAKEIDFAEKDIRIEEQVYDAGVDTLLHIVRSIDGNVRSAFLVGHNPGMTELANTLTMNFVENLPTCSIFCVEFDAVAWKDIPPRSGSLRFFDYPKKHQ